VEDCQVKFWAGFLFAAFTLNPLPEPGSHTTEVWVVNSVPEPVQEWQPTPYADSLVDWDRQALEEECLWRLLQDGGWDITYETVVTLSDWAALNGGACQMIGEDDD